MPEPSDRLDSWKEVAGYLNRGARTVQRWEREEGLPVHRLQHDKLGSVYAYRNELDSWWTSRRSQLENEVPQAPELAESIAVLPFADLSAEQDQGYFCEGMAEEIIHSLSQAGTLRVASRTSAFRFKGREVDSREIGRSLRVKTLLEGSIRKAGRRVRIAVQLTDAENGYTRWSETLDREFGDVFAIQQEIAEKIARALGAAASPKQPPPTRSIEAYECYLRGRTYYYRYGPRDIECAMRLFLAATERDPEYSLAYAGLADCWSYLYLYAERSSMLSEQAEWAGRKAVELAASSARAQASLALALSLGRHDEEAGEAFERAIRLDPDSFEAHYFYARHCFVVGRSDKAVVQYEAAMRIAPDDFQSRLLVAQLYEDQGRADDSRAVRVRGVELAEQHLRLNPDDVRAVYMAANGMAALGERERAREWADRALVMRPNDGMVLYNVGCVYSMLGCVDQAIATLTQAVRHGLTQKGWYEHDNNLDALRSDPRFRDLIAAL